MAKPRVFISSTYYDLKHVRASLEVFVESLGFEPILAEYGSIAYDPTQPLDESCYREAQSSDILVLIIGGRYGSIASSQTGMGKKREEELESITRREFSRAHEADIPTFVLVEHGVFSEYQTYLRNKDNKSIVYAHVDSPDVFKFIEFIYSKTRNNPIQSFEKGADIEVWLRDQWAGIFQELLRQRKASTPIADLAGQIRQLEAINTTLKSYLENVLESISPETSSALIERENLSLSKAQLVEKLRKNNWFDHLCVYSEDDPRHILDIHSGIETVSDVLRVYDGWLTDPNKYVSVLDALLDYDEARRDFNSMLSIMGRRPVRFSKKFLDELSSRIDSSRKDPLYKKMRLPTLDRPKNSESNEQIID